MNINYLYRLRIAMKILHFTEIEPVFLALGFSVGRITARRQIYR